MNQNHLSYTIEVNTHSYSVNEFENDRFEVTRIDQESKPINPLQRGLVIFNPQDDIWNFEGETNINQNDHQFIIEKLKTLHLRHLK